MPLPWVRLPSLQTAPSMSSIVWAGSTHSLGFYTERWRVNLGGMPLAGPVVGADGFIAVPLDADGSDSAVALVRPDGRLYGTHAILGKIVGGLTAVQTAPSMERPTPATSSV